MKSRLHVVCLFIALLAGTIQAQNFAGGFPFAIPWDDTTSSPWLPEFAKAPITGPTFVTADGDAFTRGGQPIRFYGANMVAEGAFPLKELAARVAGRYRNLGFNLVRFHHIDNPWTAYSLLYQDGASTRTLRLTMLDRLEYLISHLKANGVYVNMNLHVSRTMTEADGIVDADSIAEYGKGVNYFDPEILALHKEYARQLLTHVNPYTGLALVDDPVLAMVEITNENSLYFMWRSGMLRPYRQGGILIRRHQEMLDQRWHSFLSERYGSTDAVAGAWGSSVPEGPNRISGTFETSIPAVWQLERHETAAATVARDASQAASGSASARVSVTAVTGTEWHIQWKHTGISLKKDSVYTVRFSARADANRSVPLTVQRDVSPWDAFKSFTVPLTTEWKLYEFAFTAPETVNGVTRLSFSLGGRTGSVWFDDVALVRSGLTGLRTGETLEDGTIVRIEHSDASGYSDQRVSDLTQFYIGLQDAYFEEMTAYLKNELGVRVPITGVSWNFGPPDQAVQAKLDYVDNHAYWDHPWFPGTPWDSWNWQISNTPMVREVQGGSIAALMSGTAADGKPYTVSEYNHSSPNRYQAEGPLFLTAYAALHGVDGLMYFNYNDTSVWASDRITGFFPIHRNPAMLALMPSLAHAYRQGLIAPANETVQVRYSNTDVGTFAKVDAPLFDRRLAMRHRVATASFDDAENNLATLPPGPQPPYVSDTDELRWDPSGLFTVEAPRIVAAAGFLNEYTGRSFGPVTMVNADGFGVVTWLSLTDDVLGEARLSLFTLSTMAQNSGMTWSGTTSVNTNWGYAPTSVRPLDATFDLQIAADSIRIYPLSASGEEGAPTTVYPTEPGRFRVTLDQAMLQSMWFGIEARGTGTASIPTAPVELAVFQSYPNPASSRLVVPFTVPASGKVLLTVYDLLGRRVLAETHEVNRGRNDIDIDATALPSGSYFVSIGQAGQSVVGRFVVAH